MTLIIKFVMTVERINQSIVLARCLPPRDAQGRATLPLTVELVHPQVAQISKWARRIPNFRGALRACYDLCLIGGRVSCLARPKQPDISVCLQEWGCADQCRFWSGCRAGIGASSVVMPTARQSRIAPPSDVTGGREARSQWCERLVRTGGDERRWKSTDDNIGKPRPPRSLVPA